MFYKSACIPSCFPHFYWIFNCKLILFCYREASSYYDLMDVDDMNDSMSDEPESDNNEVEEWFIITYFFNTKIVSE